MADITIDKQRVITIPANEETGLIFPNRVRGITLINQSTTVLYVRSDGQNATIGDASSNVTEVSAGITGFDLFIPSSTSRISCISAKETVVQIFNNY